MKLIDQYYRELAAAPSDLDGYKRVLEHVRKGCIDTTNWAGDVNIANGVKHLQEGLIERASAIALHKLSCGAGVTLHVMGTGFSLPFSHPIGVPLTSLMAAGKELHSLRGGPGSLPGNDLEAVGLLLQAVAEIERALSCPAGFTKRQA